MRLAARNPMIMPLRCVLVFQAIALGLAFPGMRLVLGLPLGTALVATAGPVLLALSGAALLRRAVGFGLGWATQVAGLAAGALSVPQLWLAALFAALWATGFVLGRRLEA